MTSMDANTVSNEDLLKASGRGDREAFQRLYQQTNRRVYAYLSRLLSNHSLVDDLFVDVYSEIWKSAGNYLGNSSATTWIIGVARNMAMNHLKRQRHHDELDAVEHRLPAHEDEAVEQQQRIGLVHRALAELKPQHREILGLIMLRECSYQTVADIMDIPINTAKTRVFYAKDLLRKKLIEMGVSNDDL